MDAVQQDVRYAVRAFVRRPAFALSAVISLGIGIAATSAVFSVLNALLFKAIPGVTRPGRENGRDYSVKERREALREERLPVGLSAQNADFVRSWASVECNELAPTFWLAVARRMGCSCVARSSRSSP